MGRGVFRGIWWTTNLLLLGAMVCVVYTAVWEFSVRRYLDGFSDAIVADSAPAEQQVEAILRWMRSGPAPMKTANVEGLATRDPETTLNYRQLLTVCGTATNAFLNLARSNGLKARRLLLLAPNGTATHVVAEVFIDGRWVIADAAYHLLLRDSHGNLLTRGQLRDPTVLAEATAQIPGYLPEYSYERVAHVRLSKLPLRGFYVRPLLDHVFPGWEEKVDWTLLLERESFLSLCLALVMLVFLVAARSLLAWYADTQLKIKRFHLRARFLQAGTTLMRAPEIK